MKNVQKFLQKYWNQFDQRLKNYTRGLSATTLLYLLLFFNAYADTLVMIIFFVATYFLVFSNHRKYYSEEEVADPEPYVEQNVRLNLYSFRFIFLVAASSFAFFLLTSVLGLKAGIVSLVIWIFLAVCYQTISVQGRYKLHDELLRNYVIQSMQDQTQNTTLLSEIVNFYTSNNLITNPDMFKIIKERFNKYPESIIVNTFDKIIEFENAFRKEYE